MRASPFEATLIDMVKDGFLGYPMGAAWRYTILLCARFYDLCWWTKAPVGMIWVRGVWCGSGTLVWPSFRTHSCITRHYFLKFDVYSSGDMRKIQRKDLMIHDSTNCPYWSPLDLLGLLTFLAFMDLGVRSCKVPKATVIVLSDICWLFCENESPYIRTFFYIAVTIRMT